MSETVVRSTENQGTLEISGTHGNRIHKLRVPGGVLKVDYAATVTGRTDPAPVTEYDESVYLAPVGTRSPISSSASRQRNSVSMSDRRRCWRGCPHGWVRG